MVSRKSTFIRRQQATFSRPALLLAEQKGLPLNILVTLNFTHTEINAEGISEAFSKVRSRLMRWAASPPKRDHLKPFKTAFMWVIENTGHVAAHWLVHVPPKYQAAFKKNLQTWMEKEVGILKSPAAIDVRQAYNPHGARKYMLKGIDPLYAPLYRIDHVSQGVVYGKRFGFSQNIGPKECLEHGTKRRWRGNFYEYNPAA